MNETKNIHAVSLGRIGGKSTSIAKQEASRKNGKMGGRPKKRKSEEKLEVH